MADIFRVISRDGRISRTDANTDASDGLVKSLPLPAANSLLGKANDDRFYRYGAPPSRSIHNTTIRTRATGLPFRHRTDSEQRVEKVPVIRYFQIGLSIRERG